jgi:hypothetical protein
LYIGEQAGKGETGSTGEAVQESEVAVDEELRSPTEKQERPWQI